MEFPLEYVVAVALLGAVVYAAVGAERRRRDGRGLARGARACPAPRPRGRWQDSPSDERIGRIEYSPPPDDPE